MEIIFSILQEFHTDGMRASEINLILTRKGTLGHVIINATNQKEVTNP
jgi:hypothetical protein